MQKRRLKAPSPALVISLLALFVALGGTTYAATTLPRNSVGTEQLKKGAVTGKKIRNHTIAKKKITNKTMVALKGNTGPQGPAGPTGAKGATGATGPIGPSNAYFNHAASATVSLSVPAGAYAISGQGIFSPINTSQQAEGGCTLQVNGQSLSTESRITSSYVPGPGLGNSVSPVSGVAHLSAAGTISNFCIAGINTSLTDNAITAIKVGTATP